MTAHDVTIAGLSAVIDRRYSGRTGINLSGLDEIKRDLIDNLFYLLGKFPEVANTKRLVHCNGLYRP